MADRRLGHARAARSGGRRQALSARVLAAGSGTASREARGRGRRSPARAADRHDRGVRDLDDPAGSRRRGEHVHGGRLRDRGHAVNIDSTDPDATSCCSSARTVGLAHRYPEGGHLMSQSLDPVTPASCRQAQALPSPSLQASSREETIERYIAESVDLLGDAPINVFVPVLAHRFARERLKALAQAEGTREGAARGSVRLRPQRGPQPDGRRPREAALRRAASTSAPPAAPPATRSTPRSSRRWSEIGVDMGEEFPKPLTDEVVRAADVVITMGCGDACPIYPGKRYEDWVLDDPAGPGRRLRPPDPRRDRRPRPDARRRTSCLDRRFRGAACRGDRYLRARLRWLRGDHRRRRATRALGAVGVSLVFGLAIMAMIYATGTSPARTSTPAVTLAFTPPVTSPAATRSPTSRPLVAAPSARAHSSGDLGGHAGELGATVPTVGCGRQ